MASISPLTPLITFLAILTIVEAHSQLILTIVNNCPCTIWPAILPNYGFPILQNGGFALTTLSYRPFPVPNTHWAGRIWARTGCTDANHQFRCASGDCGGRLECNGLGGQVPATLAQFNIHNDNMDHSVYGVSLVDGFNLPMTITPHGGNGPCPVVGCMVNLLKICPEPLKLMGPNGDIVGCKSGCVAFNSDQLCCRNQFSTSQSCHASTYSQFFKNSCPATFTYAFDKPSLAQDCVAPHELKVIFCPSSM